jgi:hypothetical protein
MKTPEEFDMNTNEGRLAYAIKYYPIGTVVKSIHHDKVYKLTGEPRKYLKTTIRAESHGVLPDIYHAGVWAKIIDEVKEEKKMETQKLSRVGLKEIHSVACSSWKSSLELLGASNPLEDYIELNQDQIDAMFKACTSSQLPIVSKYLKQDDGSVDFKDVTVSKEVFIYNGEYFLQKRSSGEYDGKAFWLDKEFNWEIKTDSVGVLCLIPTKKK